MASVEQNVREIAERVAGALGVEIVEIEFRGTGGKSRMLRVYIDRPPDQQDTSDSVSTVEQLSGVTHEDCVAFSNEFGTIVDAENAVPGAGYTLEVSSPGLDRKLVKLQDYSRFTGHLVKVTTREPVNGQRNFKGRLDGLQDGMIGLRPQDGGRSKKGKRQTEETESADRPVVRIALANVERANLVPEW
ncbi:MAG: ribosome maturation factor RimP [Acidobacteria bacterium]|nr:ribosome maturation factor RimP [Acidobacteriota bacterium]